jgi:hypothetical protein
MENVLLGRAIICLSISGPSMTHLSDAVLLGDLLNLVELSNVYSNTKLPSKMLRPP